MIGHIDIHAVEHCCYSCKDCGHFSPHKAPRNNQAADFISDLQAIHEWAGLTEVCVLGGEPFLHPDLRGFLKEIRNAGPWRIRLVTNGFWGEQHPEWVREYKQIVDMLQVCLHGETRLTWREAQRIFCGAYGIADELWDKRDPGSGGWHPLLFSEADVGDRFDPSHSSVCPWIGCYALHEGTLWNCAVQAYGEQHLVGSAFWAARNTSDGTGDGFQVAAGSKEQLEQWLARHPAACHFCRVGYEKYLQRQESGQPVSKDRETPTFDSEGHLAGRHRTSTGAVGTLARNADASGDGLKG